MGGSGSGLLLSINRKSTVEECKILDIFILNKKKHWPLTSNYSTSLTWTYKGSGEKAGSIGYEVFNNEKGHYLELSYTVVKTDEKILERVNLAPTRPYFGGLRYWFICPLVVNGRPCNRRVAKLYLAPGSKLFGCRHCHNLNYNSSQDSGKYDGLFARLALSQGITPERVKRILKKKDTPEAGRLMDEMLYL